MDYQQHPSEHVLGPIGNGEPPRLPAATSAVCRAGESAGAGHGRSGAVPLRHVRSSQPDEPSGSGNIVGAYKSQVWDRPRAPSAPHLRGSSGSTLGDRASEHVSVPAGLCGYGLRLYRAGLLTIAAWIWWSSKPTPRSHHAPITKSTRRTQGRGICLKWRRSWSAQGERATWHWRPPRRARRAQLTWRSAMACVRLLPPRPQGRRPASHRGVAWAGVGAGSRPRALMPLMLDDADLGARALRGAGLGARGLVSRPLAGRRCCIRVS